MGFLVVIVILRRNISAILFSPGLVIYPPSLNTPYVQFVSMERRFLKFQLPGKRFERWTGIHPADRNILYRGLGLRMARSGIASFVVVGGYLFAIDRLLPK